MPSFSDLPAGFDVESSQPGVSSYSDLPKGFTPEAAPASEPAAATFEGPGGVQMPVAPLPAPRLPEDRTVIGYMGIPSDRQGVIDPEKVLAGTKRNISDYVSSAGRMMEGNLETGGSPVQMQPNGNLRYTAPPSPEEAKRFERSSNTPIVPLSEGIPEGTLLHGLAKGTESLITPENIGIAVAAWPLGTATRLVQAGWSSTGIQALNLALSGYFTVQMARGASSEVKAAYDSYQHGDLDGIADHLGAATVEGILAGLGAYHGARGLAKLPIPMPHPYAPGDRVTLPELRTDVWSIGHSGGFERRAEANPTSESTRGGALIPHPAENATDIPSGFAVESPEPEAPAKTPQQIHEEAAQQGRMPTPNDYPQPGALTHLIKGPAAGNATPWTPGQAPQNGVPVPSEAPLSDLPSGFTVESLPADEPSTPAAVETSTPAAAPKPAVTSPEVAESATGAKANNRPESGALEAGSASAPEITSEPAGSNNAVSPQATADGRKPSQFTGKLPPVVTSADITALAQQFQNYLAGEHNPEEQKRLMSAALDMGPMNQPDAIREQFDREIRPQMDQAVTRAMAQSPLGKKITPETPLSEMNVAQFREHRPEQALDTSVLKDQRYLTPETIGRDGLLDLSNKELESILQLHGLTQSGKKEEKVDRLLNYRSLLAKYGNKPVTDLEQFPGKELDSVLDQLGAYKGGNKHAKAISILNTFASRKRAGENLIAEANYQRLVGKQASSTSAPKPAVTSPEISSGPAVSDSSQANADAEPESVDAAENPTETLSFREKANHKIDIQLWQDANGRWNSDADYNLQGLMGGSAMSGDHTFDTREQALQHVADSLIRRIRPVIDGKAGSMVSGKQAQAAAKMLHWLHNGIGLDFVTAAPETQPQSGAQREAAEAMAKAKAGRGVETLFDKKEEKPEGLPFVAGQAVKELKEDWANAEKAGEAAAKRQVVVYTDKSPEAQEHARQNAIEHYFSFENDRRARALKDIEDFRELARSKDLDPEEYLKEAGLPERWLKKGELEQSGGSTGEDGAGNREGGISRTGAASERQPLATGKETTVLVPGEDVEIPARYEVWKLRDLITSHNGLNFLRNPEYTAEDDSENERDYSKPENQQRVITQSDEKRFRGRYLVTDNPDGTNGPPVVIRQTRKTVGGNSRGMTMQIVYARNGKAAESYLEILNDEAGHYGMRADSWTREDQPVLVRVVDLDDLAHLPGGSKWAIRKTNVSGTAALSQSERATADAGQLTPEMMADIADTIERAGTDSTLNEALTGPRGTALVNQLIAQGFFSEQERPSLMDGKTGALTQAAKDRISKALLGQFFADSDQFQRFPAAIKQKLERVAAPLATLGGDPRWDLLPQVREAVNLIEYADAHGIKNLDDVTAQQDMFSTGDSPWSPEAITLAHLLRDAKPNAVVSAFRRYVASKEPTMFGESTPDEAFIDAFGGSGGTFLRSLRDESFDKNASNEQLVAHMDFEHRPATQDSPAMLRVTPHVTELLRRATGEHAFAGALLNAADLSKMRPWLLKLMTSPQLDIAGRDRVLQLLNVIRKATDAKNYLIVSENESADPEEFSHYATVPVLEGPQNRAIRAALANHTAIQKAISHLQQIQYVQTGHIKDALYETIAKVGIETEWPTLWLTRGEAIQAAAHIFQTLSKRYGAKTAAQMTKWWEPSIRKEVDDLLRSHTGRTPEMDVSARPGSGSAIEGGPRSPEEEEDGGGTLRSLKRSGEDDGQPDLFGDEATRKQIGDAVGEYRDRLEHDRLTAEFNSLLTPKTKRSKAKPQTSLFEPNEPEAPQGSLFDRNKENDVFLGSGLGALQPYVEKLLQQEAPLKAKQVAEIWKIAKDDLQKLLAPAAREGAAPAALSVREHASELARATDRARAALALARKFFDKQPKEANYNFIDWLENGADQPRPDMQAFADTMRRMLDTRREAIQALGTGKLRSFIEDYFPHVWKRPEQAAAAFQNWAKRPLEGSKSFLKKRTLPTFADGIEAGLEPISDNPVDLVLAKCREMDKYLSAHHILRDLKEKGQVKFVDAREKGPLGWQKIEDPIATVYGPSIQNIPEYPNEGLWTGLQRAATQLGVHHERGFINLRGAVGRAYQAKGLIRTFHGTGEDVIAHELGHQIDWLAGSGKKFVLEHPDKQTVERIREARQTLKNPQATKEQRKAAREELDSLHDAIQDRKQFAKELRDLADLRGGNPSYTHKREEKMALLAQMWLANKALFEKTAPHVFARWKEFLNENPKLHALRDLEANAKLTETAQPYDVGGLVIKGHWWAPEPAARILNNYLSPGLREQSALFRGYLSAANLLNAWQLSMSAFHLGFTTMDVATSKLALGIYQAAHGDVKQGLQSAAHSLPELAGPLTGLAGIAAKKLGYEGVYHALTPFSNLLRGDKMMREWFGPGTEGEEIGKLIDATVKAGGRARMDSFYTTHLSERVAQLWRQGNVFGALLHGVFAVPEYWTRFLMEEIVPRQKLGVFADLAAYELQRLGADASVPEVQAALARAWDSVDNRLGQLVYDNLFWNKTVKDLAMASVRSVGWNLGTLREIGGGLVDTGKLLTNSGKDILLREHPPGSGEWDAKRRGEFTTRMSYILALPILTGILGAIAYYLIHGHGPKELKDYYAVPDEHGHRYMAPSYMKDVESYANNPTATVRGKIHPMASLIWQMLSDTDYFGKPIANPHHPFVKRWEERVKYVLEQFAPIAYRGNSKHQKPTMRDEVLGFFGIKRAPKRIEHPEQMQNYR